ncbi:polysaccharide deacetylase family protein [Anaeromicrobium sediminis]|uniref:NodB homology domain-containing protein n=1 Tax=Anaeromicrobium sediminis TaxID=1478221 RepID=A0A267MH66_9FIRM|nr:polysaccharide deacetylase family protein [Anaeromicrobium sediminis]PAB58268.1 hypothetical protein CCE28_15850 [Anaeromicrobium sediminis]
MRKKILVLMILLIISILNLGWIKQEQDSTKKLDVLVTIDVECNRGDKPTLITGEGVSPKCGMYNIMDILEEYEFEGSFFVNVYEHKNYAEGVMANITKDIVSRGHEINLHAHPNSNLSFYNKGIENYNLEQQVYILNYGKNLIEKWTGVSPLAFRGGSYRINDDTFKALKIVGIPVDSTVYYENDHNKISNYKTINKVTKYNDIIEVPIIELRRKTSKGFKRSKFDVDWLTYDELIQVLEQAKNNDLKILNLMLHSFTFADMNGKSGGKLILQIGNKNIYGVDNVDIDDFKKMLEYIKTDDDIDIVTFKEWYEKYSDKDMINSRDFIPVIYR